MVVDARNVAHYIAGRLPLRSLCSYCKLLFVTTVSTTVFRNFYFYQSDWSRFIHYFIVDVCLISYVSIYSDYMLVCHFLGYLFW